MSINIVGALIIQLWSLRIFWLCYRYFLEVNLGKRIFQKLLCKFKLGFLSLFFKGESRFVSCIEFVSWWIWDGGCVYRVRFLNGEKIIVNVFDFGGFLNFFCFVGFFSDQSLFLLVFLRFYSFLLQSNSFSCYLYFLFVLFMLCDEVLFRKWKQGKIIEFSFQNDDFCQSFWKVGIVFLFFMFYRFIIGSIQGSKVIISVIL